MSFFGRYRGMAKINKFVSGEIILVALLFLIFVYFRIVPIVNQTVPYTYDQGRDFLKVEEIIRYKNLTFIGPTTGIMGIYHGAWWYYLLAIPYIIAQGHPSGFSLFMLTLSFLQVFLFFLFLKKEFNFKSALFFLILITVSPYFILTSFFVISSIPVLPLLLLLFYSTYQFFKTKRIIFQFLIFFSLGFIFETEVPPGLFIIPSYLMTLAVTKEIKYFFSSKKHLLYSFFGLLISFIPRILFEIKNNFMQTKTIVQFLAKPKFYSPQSFKGVLFDRLNLFWDYYKGLFIEWHQILALVILIIGFLGILYGYKKLTKLHQRYFRFVFVLLIFLFLLSLFYKDTFWMNYYEGLSYFYVVLLSVGFYALTKYHGFLKTIPILILLLLSVLTLNKFVKDITQKKDIPLEGLRSHMKIVSYLYEKNKGKNFCVRIYTPPVIPYTYQYLFSFYSKTKGLANPGQEFVNDTCWYIIEDDQYQFRIEKWRKENIPQDASLVTSKIFKDKKIETWKIK